MLGGNFHGESKVFTKQDLLAGMFGFTRKAVLTIPEAERATPDVKNLFNS